MTKHLKIFMLMLGLMSTTSISLPAQPVTSAKSNVLTFVQTDDEMFELEGEESDLDYYDAEVDQAKETKKNGTSFGGIISYILHTATQGQCLAIWIVNKKCFFADGGDGVGDGDAGQSAAVIECIVADGCDGAGNVHAC